MDKVDKDELMDKSKGLNREMKEKRGRLIFLSQIVSFRVGWWVSNTVSISRTPLRGARYIGKNLSR